MRLEELRSELCHLTALEYTALTSLTSWLPAPRENEVAESAEGLGATVVEAGETLITSGKTLITRLGRVWQSQAVCSNTPSRRRWLVRAPSTAANALAASPAQCLPCIGGQIIGALQHNRLAEDDTSKPGQRKT